MGFEQFFNRLMSADPAAFDPNAPPARRLSRFVLLVDNKKKLRSYNVLQLKGQIKV